MTVASNKLAKAQELSTAKGPRAAVPLYIDAAQGLISEQRADAAASALLDVLNLREKKRSLFGSKEINPLGPDRALVGKHFARATRIAAVNDAILELLGTLAAEYPDDSEIRLANAEALYRSAYIADAIDEYRYCEQLLPDDGSLMARLGELYAMVSRNAEAIDSLRAGISRLCGEQKYDGVAVFCLKLIEIAPESAPDVHAWIADLPEDAFGAQRDAVTKILDAVRERGADDGRWADVEARLASLPHVEVAVAAASLPEYEQAPNAWDTESTFEPVSEDEMRMLLGPPAAEEFTATANNGARHAPAEEDEEEQRSSPQGLHINAGRAQPTSAAEESGPGTQGQEAVAEPVRSPEAAASVAESNAAVAGATSSGAALPPGLAAYTRRKADGLLAAADYQAAAPCYERLLKAGFEPDIASPLLDCYLQLDRHEDAAALGLQLADHEAAAGEIEKAVETLSKILAHTPDAQVVQRRSELLAATQG